MLSRLGCVLTQNSQRRLAAARFASTSSIQLPSSSEPQSTDPQTSDQSTRSQPEPTVSASPDDQASSSSSSIPTSSASLPIPSEAQAHPYAGAKDYADNQEQSANSSSSSLIPTLHTMRAESSRRQMHAIPPFNTHHFFVELEKTFPSPSARSLMRATRALLVDRIGRVRRDALTSKDLENVRDVTLNLEVEYAQICSTGSISFSSSLVGIKERSFVTTTERFCRYSSILGNPSSRSGCTR